MTCLRLATGAIGDGHVLACLLRTPDPGHRVHPRTTGCCCPFIREKRVRMSGPPAARTECSIPFVSRSSLSRLWGHHASAHVPCRADVLNLFLACIAQTGSVGWQRLDSSKTVRWGASIKLCGQLPPLGAKASGYSALSLPLFRHLHIHTLPPPSSNTSLLPDIPASASALSTGANPDVMSGYTNTYNTMKKKLSRNNLQHPNPAGSSGQSAPNNPSGGLGKASKVLGEEYVPLHTRLERLHHHLIDAC